MAASLRFKSLLLREEDYLSGNRESMPIMVLRMSVVGTKPKFTGYHG